ncbi:RAD9 [[Candida] subhashii]|uniref:RAD9 n=1 Tax=[Candida] subhashii TaxID=561895 RepID=A0A8J5Q5V5_9ASCO|nr:RAD9 [[Candida] subhashii]KAG7660876.1 RAD9 [[Candida] subhashii]
MMEGDTQVIPLEDKVNISSLKINSQEDDVDDTQDDYNSSLVFRNDHTISQQQPQARQQQYEHPQEDTQVDTSNLMTASPFNSSIIISNNTNLIIDTQKDEDTSDIIINNNNNGEAQDILPRLLNGDTQVIRNVTPSRSMAETQVIRNIQPSMGDTQVIIPRVKPIGDTQIIGDTQVIRNGDNTQVIPIVIGSSSEDKNYSLSFSNAQRQEDTRFIDHSKNGIDRSGSNSYEYPNIGEETTIADVTNQEDDHHTQILEDQNNTMSTPIPKSLIPIGLSSSQPHNHDSDPVFSQTTPIATQALEGRPERGKSYRQVLNTQDQLESHEQEQQEVSSLSFGSTQQQQDQQIEVENGAAGSGDGDNSIIEQEQPVIQDSLDVILQQQQQHHKKRKSSEIGNNGVGDRSKRIKAGIARSSTTIESISSGSSSTTTRIMKGARSQSSVVPPPPVILASPFIEDDDDEDMEEHEGVRNVVEVEQSSPLKNLSGRHKNGNIDSDIIMNHDMSIRQPPSSPTTAYVDRMLNNSSIYNDEILEDEDEEQPTPSPPPKNEPVTIQDDINYDNDDDDDDEDSIVLTKPTPLRKKHVIDSQSTTNTTTTTITTQPDPTQSIHPTPPQPITAEEGTSIDQSQIMNPQSVWVVENLKLHPGHLVDPLPQQQGGQVRVEFGEGVYVCPVVDLEVLDIRIGDIVGRRHYGGMYIVVGLSCSGGNGNGDEGARGRRIRCVRGFDTVHIVKKNKKKKNTRKGKGKKKVDEDVVVEVNGGEEEEIRVGLSDIYMELSDWIMHQSRFQLMINGQNIFLEKRGISSINTILSFVSQPPPQPVQQISMILPSTPIKYPSTNVLTFESKSLRRSPIRITPTEPITTTTSTAVDPTGLPFTGRIFVITSIDGPRKDSIKQKIESHGGTLLDCELTDLFTTTTTLGSPTLVAKIPLNNICFFGMLSNSHCRSAKYLQSLALGWPILCDKYIDDVTSQKVGVEEWTTYLLPAGFSKRLDTVRSHDVYKFRKNYEMGVMMDGQLGLNCGLLAGVDVVVLKGRMNLVLEESCRFILGVFGVKSIRWFESAEGLIKAVEGDALVYDESGMVGKSLAKKKKGRNKKQNGSGEGVVLKLIDWEWVVQCVISGKIWEPSETFTLDL